MYVGASLGPGFGVSTLVLFPNPIESIDLAAVGGGNLRGGCAGGTSSSSL